MVVNNTAQFGAIGKMFPSNIQVEFLTFKVVGCDL